MMKESTAPVPERAVKPPKSRLLTWGKRALWANMILAFLFVYVPIIILVVFSFNDSKLAADWKGFTFDWYRSLVTSEAILIATRNSLMVAGISTVAGTLIGTMTAIAMERFHFPFRKLYDGILYLPVITPEIITGVSLLAFFSLILSALNNLLGLSADASMRTGLTTVTLTHIAFNTAFVAVVVRARLKDFNKSLEEAAQDLGADEWTTFRRITLPLIMPGILAGALLAFTLSLDNFVITSFTTGPGGTTLPIEVFGRIRRAISPEINAISTIMLAFSILLVIGSQVLQRRNN